MDIIPTAVLNGLPVGGLVSIFFFMLAKGWIVTKGEHSRALAASDDRVAEIKAEREEWKLMALRSVGLTERMARPVEVVAEVMQRLPDPSAGEEARK